MRFAGEDNLEKPLQVKGTTNGSLIAGRPSNMPAFIYESIQRQYGRGSGGYTIEDKKNVLDWNQGRFRI